MRYLKIIIISVLINLFFLKTYAVEKKLPLNKDQNDLIDKYRICEEYSQCELETLIKLIEITDSRYEYFEPILVEFVDRLVLLGDVASWKKYEYLIDDFLFYNDEGSNTYKVYISSLWGWRLYSVKEIRNYEKALKLLNYSIETPGNVEMTGNAYFALGVIYEQGRAVKQDFKKAIDYYLEASKRGDHYGFYRVSLHYILGNHKIKKNFNKAIKYLKLSNASWVAASDISLLKILFEKERLPNDIKELESWILSDYKKTGNANNFILVARGFEMVGKYETAYKYHYLIEKILGKEDGFASTLEIKNYINVYIDKDRSEELMKEADLILIN